MNERFGVGDGLAFNVTRTYVKYIFRKWAAGGTEKSKLVGELNIAVCELEGVDESIFVRQVYDKSGREVFRDVGLEERYPVKQHWKVMGALGIPRTESMYFKFKE